MGKATDWESSRGATLVESALLMLLIAAFAFSAVQFFGSQVGVLTDQVADGADGSIATPTTSTTTAVDTGGSNSGGTDGGGSGDDVGIPFVCEDFDPSSGLTPPEECEVGDGG